MVWRARERDPKSDPAASDVMAAYRAATKAGMPTAEGYQAGVEAWRRVHPDQKPAYAAKQAVGVILAANRSRCGALGEGVFAGTRMAGAKMEDIRPGQVSVVGAGRRSGHPRGIQC